MSQKFKLVLFVASLLVLGTSIKDSYSHNMSAHGRRVGIVPVAANVWAGASCAVTYGNGSKAASYFCTIWGAAESIAIGILCPPAGIICAV